MRFVVFGAGAIGGAVGARLFQKGHDVTLVARGAHGEALRTRGLKLEAPDETVTLRIPAHADAVPLDWNDDTVVLLAVKGQHTEEALTQLAAAPPRTPVVCMQNGVENERRVRRRFAHTYGMCVMCPATQLRPGVVQVHSAPVTGLMDLGRYPEGMDEAKQRLPELVYCADAYETMAGADALVLLTEWNAFRALDLARVRALLASPLIIDLRNIYKPHEMIAAGLSYVSIGRPAQTARPQLRALA